MSKTTLQQRWKELQEDRVHRIRAWYEDHYENAGIGDPLIEYIVLWSIFNALYNTYDLPSHHMPETINGRYRFSDRFGYKVPIIRVSRDYDRIIKFARKLISVEGFAKLLARPKLRKCIRVFVERVPAVAQRENVDIQRQIPIVLQDANQKWTIESVFSPSAVHGVSSLDHRLFLADGYKFFEYAAIDDPWDKHGNLIDLDRTGKQLLAVLYQLRNNTVHGGIVSKTRKAIIIDALPILRELVSFTFNKSESIYAGEKP